MKNRKKSSRENFKFSMLQLEKIKYFLSYELWSCSTKFSIFV